MEISIGYQPFTAAGSYSQLFTQKKSIDFCIGHDAVGRALQILFLYLCHGGADSESRVLTPDLCTV